MDQGIEFINERELVEVLRELIAIETVHPPGNEEEAAQYMAERLRQEGMDVEVQELFPGRANVVAWLGGRSATPALMLNGHLDIVPAGERDLWNTDPFEAVVRDGRIFGRGASDNKGGVTAIFLAALAVHRAKIRLPAPVVVAGVMGEKTGGAGTTFLLDQGIHPQQAIVAEWTSASRIAIGYRGRLELSVETKGRTAHASRPHQGLNAIEQMYEVVLPALKRYVSALPFTPQPAFLINGPSIAVTMIQGGVKANVIPDVCKAQLDIRLAPGQDPAGVEEGLQRVAAELRRDFPKLGVSLTVGGHRFPFMTSPETVLVQELAACIHEGIGRDATLIGKTGCSDGNILAERFSMPIVAYGPGNDSGHSPNEFVEVKDLLDCTRVLAAAIPRLAQAKM